MKLWPFVIVLVGWQVVNAGGRLTGVGHTVTITVPTSAATFDNGTTATVTISGTALSDRTVTGCTYTNSLGGSGSATGTASWTLGSIALTEGDNVITVTCTNNAGTIGVDVVTVTRSGSVTCTTTLSAGGNIASAISSAAGGAVICLNNGSYSVIALGTYTKSPRVTIRSVNALGASVAGMTAGGVSPNGLTFDGITWTSIVQLGGSNQARNFTIQNCAVGTNQIDIRTNLYNNNNILIDGCTFGAFDEDGGQEGRLSILFAGGPGSNPAGVTASNNTFGPGGCSDGIQIGGNGIVVGPGNIFTGVIQGSCSTHVDGMQGFGDIDTVVTGNYCDDSNTVCIGWYDDGDGMTFTNNVVSGVTSFRGLTNSTITHNTFDGASFRIEGKSGSPGALTIQNNLFYGSGLNGSTACSGCTISNNMFDGAAFMGSSNLAGTPPTFTGGASPATWAGYLLTALSVGKSAGTDGFDMGTLVYGQ